MKIIERQFVRASIILMLLPVLHSCSDQNIDKEIKKDITIKAKEDVSFANVEFFVDKGRVTLTGSCPTEKLRSMLKQKLKTIHIIDSVDDQLKIAPVILSSIFTTKKDIDSVLADYPMVIARVSDTGIVLLGRVKRQEASKLLTSITKVNTNTLPVRQSLHVN